MTLKQQRLAKEIMNPANKSLKEAGLRAGYKGGNSSRQIYTKQTKSNIAEILKAQGITRESLTEAYNELFKLCQSKTDYSTAKATLDSIAKLHNFLRDNNLQQVTVDIGDTLNKLREQPKPIDVVASGSTTYNNAEPKLT